jgi:hypothetical protein
MGDAPLQPAAMVVVQMAFSQLEVHKEVHKYLEVVEATLDL